ncbi:hypothetical protein ACFPIJ_51965 [Dactylosporangium cerinum]|uniref:Uncharacterized protein n=1 Tax=Dactylosporangium cerinum TaxID=1434730 RepID=A0ABV9WC30_9ACTN
MMVDGPDVIVRVSPGDGGDDEEVAALVRRLRAELLELDVERVEALTEDTAPDGAKGLGSLVGLLGVTLGSAGLSSVLAIIRDWATRNNHAVELTIDGDTVKVARATPQQQEQLINAWVARHAGSA